MKQSETKTRHKKGCIYAYTPEKNQSSVPGALTILKTPRCQSAELVDVEAATFWTTFLSGSDPVEAQSPTVPAENCNTIL